MSVTIFAEKVANVNGPKITEAQLAQLMTAKDVDVARVNFLIHEALQRKRISPDAVLVTVPQVWFNDDGLVPFAMALRAGADPNTYIRREGISSIHIISYLFSFVAKLDKYNPTDVPLEKFLILLLLTGADLEAPLFPTVREKRNPNARRVLKEIDEKGMSLPLLDDNNYDADAIMLALRDPAYDEYRVMLDITLTSSSSPSTLAVAKQAITFFSSVVFDLQTITDDIGPSLLEQTVHRYNNVAFKKLVEQGYLPTYPLTNEILLDLRAAFRQKDPVTSKALEDMIILAVEHSLELDLYQLNLAGAIDPNFRSVLTERYRSPYWQKVCKTPKGSSPRPLKVLAASLGISASDNKKTLCDNLTKVANTERGEFLAAAEKLQRRRFADQFASVSDFVDPPKDTISAADRDLTKGSFGVEKPESYNDTNIAVYRDDSGKIWFFDSSQFRNLLDTQINPQTDKPLPEDFLDRLRLKLKRLEDLGVMAPVSYESIAEAGVVPRVAEAYDLLNRPDSVSEKANRHDLEKFYLLGEKYRISRHVLANLKAGELKALLPMRYRALKVDQLGSDSYALVTVARVIDKAPKEEQEDFFDNLRVKTLES